MQRAAGALEGSPAGLARLAGLAGLAGVDAANRDMWDRRGLAVLYSNVVSSIHLHLRFPMTDLNASLATDSIRRDIR